ncbi:MAG: hypothetical protein UT11_C0008G0004 [Berkelbacteria bacterium GW2011_GWA2_38_9]|uniref:Uncharacterized protein n=1 Tax=Berkelbacteria bacterium GW2011_GWA2_38_9 TaxID=1618334 RepID=A0A0G0PLW6_9BACT|nr:MAG: hypothetical protein UT11_C0008G0004 [Berkelbacteria bacterium GW2011_GWA2_38_9]
MEKIKTIDSNNTEISQIRRISLIIDIIFYLLLICDLVIIFGVHSNLKFLYIIFLVGLVICAIILAIWYIRSKQIIRGLCIGVVPVIIFIGTFILLAIALRD